MKMTPIELKLQSKVYLCKKYIANIDRLLQIEQGNAINILALIKCELVQLNKELKMVDLSEEDRLW